MNTEHPKGGSKAIAFCDVLGYTKENSKDLERAILSGLDAWKARERAKTGYGKPFEVKMLLSGANGRHAAVKTSWIIDNGSSVPRLVSAYIYKQK